MQKLRSVTILWNHWSDSSWMYVLGVVLGRKPDKAASEREGGGAVGRRERCPPALPAPFLPLYLSTYLSAYLPSYLSTYLASLHCIFFPRWWMEGVSKTQWSFTKFVFGDKYYTCCSLSQKLCIWLKLCHHFLGHVTTRYFNWTWATFAAPPPPLALAIISWHYLSSCMAAYLKFRWYGNIRFALPKPLVRFG